MATKKMEIPKKIIYTTVRLKKESVEKYKKLAKKNLMPVSVLIEKAMENSAPIFEEIGNDLANKLNALSRSMGGKDLVRK